MAKPALATSLLLTLGLVGVPIAAFAASEPASQTSDYRTKKVCETIKATGTRLGAVRRCRTAAELDAIKAEARETVDRVQTLRPKFCAPPNPC